MILIHNPISALQQPALHHRRLPSAPAVVVQPTRTPGLLNIIPKAPAPRLSQQPKPRSQNRPKRESQAAETLKPTAPKVSTTPDKSPRGRQSNKPKSEKRSASLSSAQVQSRRQPRQPSPLRTPSRGETATPQANAFDVFLVNSSDTENSDSAKSLKKSGKPVPPRGPQLSKPSGKLAHRRQQVLDSPTPSKAIPVPRPKVRAAGLSRSAPAARPVPKRFTSEKVARESDMFPICDDMTDIDGDNSRPSTPVRKPSTWQQQSLVFEDGPRTAPLSSATHSFPFNFETPSPSPALARQRRHARAPSEGVFNMSFDEDSSSSSSDASEELKALFAGMVSNKRRSAQSSKEDLARSEAERAAYFASSQFQNSPSPDALPAPAFMH